MEDEKKDVDLEILKRAVNTVAEHFDTVQIFATRKEKEGTVNCRWGVGDWYARYGHCRLWVLREERGEINDVTNKERRDWE